MQPVEITKFLGLRNTVSQQKQPLGALTHAENVVIDDSGAIMRRKGSIKLASGNITSSYGTRDNSLIYVIDNGDLYSFDGTEFNLICEDMGEGTTYWCEESSSLIFARSSERYIAIKNGISFVDLNIPRVTEISTSTEYSGNLPAMMMGICAQYVHKKTGLRGALSTYTTVEIPENSTLLINVPHKVGFQVAMYGFLPDSGAWSHIGTSNSEPILLSEYPNVHEPADDVYFDVTSAPKDIVAMTYHNGRVAVATLNSDKSSSIQFSVPSFYHLFDTVSEHFEIPDAITALESVQGKLLVCCMRSIWVFDGDNLQRIATYGTPVGKPIQLLPTGEALIWTFRGVCKFPDFANLTENNFSVSAGFGCATSLYEHDGSQYLLAATDDAGQTFNANFNI